MFRSAFVALVLASTAFAGPMKRFGGLTVDVQGPAAVSNVDELKFTATVKNTGSEAVKILKYGTILDENLPTRSFVVTKDGEEVPFTGVKLQVSLSEADDSAYVFIPAGESITVNHNVATLFDFASAGTGTFKFEPVSTFHVAGSDEQVSSLAQVEQVDGTANAVEVNVTEQLEKREIVQKRATDICTNASRKSFIDAAYSEGKSMASAAASYISSNSGSSVYTAYFKTNSASTVRSKFSAVASENSSSRTLSCTDSLGACSSGVIAYTATATTNIYFCSIFFNEVPQSALCSGQTTVANRNVRGATVLHELTHAVASTVDVTYGCSADQSLSASNQLRNADNYNCFGSQVWLNTQC